MRYVKYYRVQGGDGFSRSREMLNVTSSNAIEVQARKTIHIGDEKHNKNFIKLRLADKWKKYAGLHTNKGNVDVIIMYFPEFFGNLLKQCAIPEYIATGRDPEAPPHTVDINKGEAYALCGFWNLMMKACNVYAKNSIIRNEQEINTLYNNDEEISKFHSINIQMLKNSLNHISAQAGISEGQRERIIKEAEKANKEIEEQKKGKSKDD